MLAAHETEQQDTIQVTQAAGGVGLGVRAAAVGVSAGATKPLPRLSVSSSCAGTELSTASVKVPLQVQGGGIVLQGCGGTVASSSASSCSAACGEDGLQRALHQVLAAAVGGGGNVSRKRSSCWRPLTETTSLRASRRPG
jgi:hypothetical protein